MRSTPATPLFPVHSARQATQLVFLVCGLGISSWAPMVPYVKDRLGLTEGHMGLLLLCLGAGAMFMMPVTGWLLPRLGSRRVILLATLVLVATLPLLLAMPTPGLTGLVLLVFGAGIGSVDVAMNAHGVQVQNSSAEPIMSSLHGLFSVGGLCGALGIGVLLRGGLPPLGAAGAVAGLLLLLVLSQYRHLLSADQERALAAQASAARAVQSTPSGSWWQSAVLVLGGLCFAVFLAEGVMLDWSALLLRDTKGVPEAFAGAGYATFSVAMAAMRLVGDRVVARLSPAAVVIGGSLVGALGFALLILSPWLALTLTGFALVGVGAANIVPVFFSEGGRLPHVASAVAIPAITTMGYAGQLAGPALLGFIAQHISLPAAFGCTGLLLGLVAGIYYLKSRVA